MTPRLTALTLFLLPLAACATVEPDPCSAEWIDYKTDRIDALKTREGAEKYRRQGELYCRALSDALGVEINRFAVAFLRPAVLEMVSFQGSRSGIPPSPPQSPERGPTT